MKEKIFRASWYQPTSDYRPIKDVTPEQKIIDYWHSGIRCSDDASTLVAVIISDSKENAKNLIISYWPEAVEWRFCDETNSENLLTSNRFKLSSDGVAKLTKFNTGE